MTTTTDARVQHLPTPPGPKLPGAIQTFLFPYRHLVMPRLRKRYGDVVSVELLGRPSVLLYTPELNKVVFSGSPEVFHAGEGNRVLRQIMGKHSVLTLDEDAHRRMRKLLMPPFHGAALRGYRETMTALAVAEADSWRPGAVFSAHQRMNQLTLEIILRVVFGVVEGPRLDDLRRSITKLVTQPMPVYIGEFVPSLRKFGPWRRFRELVAHVDGLLYAEIAERRHGLEWVRRATRRRKAEMQLCRASTKAGLQLDHARILSARSINRPSPSEPPLRRQPTRVVAVHERCPEATEASGHHGGEVRPRPDRGDGGSGRCEPPVGAAPRWERGRPAG